LKVHMKHVIIQAIGSANPAVAVALADAFDVNKTLMLKMLYNAPAPFLVNVTEETATKAEALLTALGIEVSITDNTIPLPAMDASYDVSIFIHEPHTLHTVARQLATFMGLADAEVLQLLLTDQAIVLGGVSKATVDTLTKRIDADVIATNPKEDLFLIKITAPNNTIINTLTETANSLGYVYDSTQHGIDNVSYNDAQTIWRKFSNTSSVHIYNKSLQRYQIVLNEFQVNDAQATTYLVHAIGMPEEIIPTVYENVPVVLVDSIQYAAVEKTLQDCTAQGLVCTTKPIPFGKYKLRLSNIEQPQYTAECLHQIYKNTSLDSTGCWQAPTPISDVLNRYLETQLETTGCIIEREYA
jgi:hypothetical protein